MSSHQEARRATANLPIRGSEPQTGVEKHCQCPKCTLSDVLESFDPPDTPSPAATQSCQLNSIAQDSLALGMHGKNQSMPNIPPDGKFDFGSECPELDSGKRMQNSTPSRQSKSLSKEQETLTGRLGRSKSNQGTISSGLIHAGFREMSTPRTDMERPSLSAYDGTTAKPVSEPFLGVPGAVGDSTPWASRLYSGGPSLESPWASTQYDEVAFHEGTTTSSPQVSAPSPKREVGSLQGNGKSPPYRSAAVPPNGCSNPSHDVAAPLVNDGIPSSCTDPSIHCPHRSRSSLLDSKTAVLKDVLEEHQTQRPQFSSNDVRNFASSPPVSSTAQEANELSHPDTPVQTVETDTTDAITAVRSTEQDEEETWASRLLSPIVAALVRYSSVLLWSSSLPSPNQSIVQSQLARGSDPFQHGDHTLPSKRPSTPVLSVGMGPQDHGDTEVVAKDSSTPQRERDPGFAITAGSPACISQFDSSGRLWQCKPTDDRAKYRHAFFKIVEVLGEKFTPDLNPGFIYAFQVEDEVRKGRKYTKIGEASNILTRMNEHKSCYGACTLVYPIPNERVLEVPYAKRVEKLVHAELVTRGLFLRPCPKPKCTKSKSHLEWFDVDAQYAIRVIRRWTRWAEKSPFHAIETVEKQQRPSKDGSISPGPPGASSPSNSNTNLLLDPSPKFGLKSFKKEDLWEMCWPLEFLPVESRDATNETP